MSFELDCAENAAMNNDLANKKLLSIGRKSIMMQAYK